MALQLHAAQHTSHHCNLYTFPWLLLNPMLSKSKSLKLSRKGQGGRGKSKWPALCSKAHDKPLFSWKFYKERKKHGVVPPELPWWQSTSCSMLIKRVLISRNFLIMFRNQGLFRWGSEKFASFVLKKNCIGYALQWLHYEIAHANYGLWWPPNPLCG